MAQTERTAKSLTWTGSGSLSTDIANLRAVINVGQPISATNINSLVGLINNAISHYHTYDDAYQLATYGNNGDRNNYYENKNTASTGISNPATVASGNVINASDHNSLRNAIDSLRTHNHSINDRTG